MQGGRTKGALLAAVAAAGLVLTCGLASAASGPGLDPGFGEGGQSTVQPNAGGLALSAAGAPGSHTFVAGFAGGPGPVRGAAVLKLGSAGNPAPNFGEAGAASIPQLPESDGAVAKSIAIDSRGRIVLSGDVEDEDGLDLDLWVARLNPDGSPDSSFSDDGYKRIHLAGTATEGGVHVGSGDRLIVGGMLESYSAHARAVAVGLKSDGKIDKRFGHDGTTLVGFGPLHTRFFETTLGRTTPVLLGQGSRTVLIASDDQAVLTARLDRHGNLDPGYGRKGKSVLDARRSDFGGTPQATAAYATDGGGVLIGGTVFGERSEGQFIPPSDGLLIELDRKGKLDRAFKGKGFVTVKHRFDDEITSVAAHGSTVYAAGRTGPEGKLSPENWFLARFSERGKPRPNGYSEPSIKGYGSFDPEAAAPSLFIQRDGKPVMAGSHPVDDDQNGDASEFLVARFER